MVEENKKLEFWNYLITEKNQPRPKGITVQRLAVIKPLALESDLWSNVIERHGARERTAREFYQSAEAASIDSRTSFWTAVREIIGRDAGGGTNNAAPQFKPDAIYGNRGIGNRNAERQRPMPKNNRRRKF